MGPKNVPHGTLGTMTDERSESRRFVHSSSKSSWTAREWFFVLALPRLWTSFCRSPVMPLAKFSLWTVPDGIRSRLFPSHVRSVFLPLECRPASHAVSVDIVANQREGAVGAAAHRNRIPRCSRICSPSEKAESRKSSPIGGGTGISKLCRSQPSST